MVPHPLQWHICAKVSQALVANGAQSRTALEFLLLLHQHWTCPQRQMLLQKVKVAVCCSAIAVVVALIAQALNK